MTQWLFCIKFADYKHTMATPSVTTFHCKREYMTQCIKIVDYKHTMATPSVTTFHCKREYNNDTVVILYKVC